MPHGSRLSDVLGLVGDEQDRLVRVCPGERTGQVRTVPGQPGGLSCHVVHAREYERVPAALHYDMGVVQRFPAQFRHAVQPALCFPEVLVVPRDVDLRQP